MRKAQVQRQHSQAAAAVQKRSRMKEGSTGMHVADAQSSLQARQASNVSLTLSGTSSGMTQLKAVTSLQQSPRMMAQLKKAESIQRKATGKLLQEKADVSQRVEDEELMQGKFDTAQLVEEEELMQPKFDTAQLMDEEELMQGKFDTAQLMEEEELMQGKFDTAQLVEEEELMQGKFDTTQLMEEDELQMKRDTVQLNLEEEEMQMKSDTAQLMEEEEMLQGKSKTTQLAEEATASPNKTGLPDNLKSGIESMSGMSMDNVKVHYNSDKPAQLNAHAYAQGTNIHVASGQEKHVPHEAWHVVQQAQGRVSPTTQTKGGTQVNDDQSLETEADVMGAKALQQKPVQKQQKSAN